MKQINPDVYLKPSKMAELAFKDDATFIKLMKENNITNFAAMRDF